MEIIIMEHRVLLPVATLVFNGATQITFISSTMMILVITTVMTCTMLAGMPLLKDTTIAGSSGKG